MAAERHTHPVMIVAIIVAFTAVAFVLGNYSSKVGQAASDAKETAEIARAVTDPACDTRTEACKRANKQRQGQGSVVPDLEEVSVVASYCGHVPTNDTLPKVRACVLAEFQRLRGRPPQLAPTTTVPGG